jgi:hypothetical protein
MQDGQLTCSMGLKWMGIGTGASKATTLPVRFLYIVFEVPQINCCILFHNLLILYIFLQRRLKMDHVKEL